MSLIKKITMTEKRLAAVRRAQKLSHGSVTDEGRERIRAARLRHGFDAPADDVALRALGEDPAHFQELVEGLWETYHPADAAQEGLVLRLARATWLTNRSDRMQEGWAVRQAQAVNIGREDRLHVQMMRLKMTAKSLELLARSVAREYYVTTPEDLEKMKNLHQDGALKEMGEIALALFSELQPPSVGKDGIDRDEQARNALRRIKEIFGLHSDTPPVPRVAFNPRQSQNYPQNAGDTRADVTPASSRLQESQQVRTPDSDGVHRTPEIGDAGGTMAHVTPASSRPPGSPQDAGGTRAGVAPASSRPSGTVQQAAPTAEEQRERYPKITAAEWDAREQPRQLLENILTRHVDICEAQRKALLKESVKGPSPYERAAEIAPTQPQAMLMRRMQDSYFREVRRVTGLLLKLKRRERKVQTGDENDEINHETDHDL